MPAPQLGSRQRALTPALKTDVPQRAATSAQHVASSASAATSVRAATPAAPATSAQTATRRALTPLPQTGVRRRALTRALLTTTVVAGGSAAAPAAARAAGPSVDGRERNVVHRINQVRADHGLRALDLTRGLSKAADRHSLRQARTRTLAHQLPGEGPLEARLRRAAGGKPVGEVVFWTSRGARSADLVRAWMDSPGHRATLLSATYSRAGIGIRSGRGGIYATVDVAG